MIDLIVRRGAGDKPGEDILDALVATTAVAIERGRTELDTYATQKADNQYETLYRAGVRLGQHVLVYDTLQGTSYRGKVVSISHDIRSNGAITNLTVERVVNF
jgi:hypothetical protein